MAVVHVMAKKKLVSPIALYGPFGTPTITRVRGWTDSYFGMYGWCVYSHGV
jgi:hypothetical protein